MKKTVLLLAAGATLFAVSCKKPTNNDAGNKVTEAQVITDFVAKTALPMYADLQTKATALNTAVDLVNTAPTDANLNAARTAWRDTRKTWEQCEGFLIGPVEADNYDPNMDTWPVDYNQLDSFITNSSSFDVAIVAGLSQSLRGFHPLEYILWGKGGSGTVATITANQKQYMVALAKDIQNTCTQLNNSWLTTGGNYQATVLAAGDGTAPYATRQALMLAMVAGIAGICDEVGTGKIYDPFTAIDSNLTESPFSHNSMTDFTNNITGSQSVYLCNFNGASGASLSSFVAANNLDLDNRIKAKYASALSALSNVTVTFELGIYTQRTQLQAAMNALADLQTTLDGELKTFVQTYVKD